MRNVVIFASPPEYTPKDQTIVKICNAIQIGSIPVFFGVCIVLAALLFYRNKLKKPIELLNEASDKIAAADLDFHLFYDSNDEMGQLCASFETMRGALDENNRTMWRAMEERKRLNATFSHDLRTPLTVLRGYTDFLKNYLPQGKVSKEKLLSTISTMSGHIDRLEKYTCQMSEIQKLEDITFNPQNVEIHTLVRQFKSTAELLSQNTELILSFADETKGSHMMLDTALIMRVYENLISNAIRYAKSTVSVDIKSADRMLLIDIADDGQGFSEEDLQMALKPYYQRKSGGAELHFGLGLYISKILCEKHGGIIIIGNTQSRGATVAASFMAK
ncbi:HAMP domain-containing histidine kinase [Fusibacter paucivorans]|uniref:histidine kinase n=1 Tax=Fusibacter paucivorans TaxID=76009 RepID=A0ABS5PNQ8_9FIRM|nr:HAMP domain-containing sensor histidine kinase [Fusibacter paucivorans]MBS7526216.1 HAMP domain-containing histidine kinase [Fusibacter paucivorans]